MLSQARTALMFLPSQGSGCSWNLKESGAHEYVTPMHCIVYIVYYVTPATDQYIVHRHISSGYLVHFCLDGGNVNPKLHTFMIAKTLHR